MPRRHARVAKQANLYQGGMYWKRQDAHEYLVRTGRDNRQKRLGPRSVETEQIYDRFTARKRQTEERLQSLTTALREAERMNKALKVGRVPSMVLSVLLVLEQAQVAEHFTVVGTHALYAYEADAGIRIDAGALATQDVDLLWDARKRVRFVSDMKRLDASMLRVPIRPSCARTCTSRRPSTPRASKSTFCGAWPRTTTRTRFVSRPTRKTCTRCMLAVRTC